jgi:very-short-patch-repair endonuclease
MRSALTPSEQFLWSRICARQLGVVFRRQVPLLGRFIADFYAPAARLVVEVDGAYHAGRVRADARRDAVLVRAGYRVLRFQAESVWCDPDAVVARIRCALVDGAITKVCGFATTSPLRVIVRIQVKLNR